MPYQENSVYNKYQSCDCDDSSNCDCNNNCGCCPIGTVEVKDSCGKHVACLLPSDAAQYYIDTLDVPEGFIKVFDSEGNYIGLLTVADYQAYLDSGGLAFSFANVGDGEGVYKDTVLNTVNLKTINVTGPATVTSDDDNIYINVQSGINVNISKDGVEDSTILLTSGLAPDGSKNFGDIIIDRNAYFGEITMTLANLPAGFTNTIPTGTATIPPGKSRLDYMTGLISFSYAGVAAGVYTFQAVFSGVGISDVTLTIEITLL